MAGHHKQGFPLSVNLTRFKMANYFVLTNTTDVYVRA